MGYVHPCVSARNQMCSQCSDMLIYKIFICEYYWLYNLCYIKGFGCTDWGVKCRYPI